MPNELIPFNNVELPIYPIVGHERGLPIVECEYDASRGTLYFNCPFCGKKHSHYVGTSSFLRGMERSSCACQRIVGMCEERKSPFHRKEYYIRAVGDEESGEWDNYLQRLDSDRGRRRGGSRPCVVLSSFGSAPGGALTPSYLYGPLSPSTFRQVPSCLKRAITLSPENSMPPSLT
jgi:hypothetical protein